MLNSYCRYFKLLEFGIFNQVLLGKHLATRVYRKFSIITNMFLVRWGKGWNGEKKGEEKRKRPFSPPPHFFL